MTEKGKKVGKYLLEKKLGQGKFGMVFLARNLETNQIFAAKQVDQKKVMSHAIHSRLLQTEINVMNTIKHPNILHLHDFIRTSNNFYLIVDYCNQGEYSSFLKYKKVQKLDEKYAVAILKQIANGFQILRKNKILHRDFKLDNMLFHNNRLVIGDFGFAKSGVDIATTILGTPITMAYELLTAGKEGTTYSSKADLWSIGVVYYQMLVGSPPFKGENLARLIQNVKENCGDNLSFPKNISKESKHLIKQILRIDPNERMSWFEFFNHPLFDLYNDVELEKSFHNISILDKGSKFEMKNSNAEFNMNKNIVDKSEATDFMSSGEMKMAKNELLISEIVETDEKTVDMETMKNIAENVNFNLIGTKFQHEINKIRYLFFTVRYIQDQLKTERFLSLLPNLYKASFSIVYIGLKYTNQRLACLNDGTNEFQFESQFFKKYIKDKQSDEILKSLQDYKKKFEAYLVKLGERMKRHKVKLDYKLIKENHIEEIKDDLDECYGEIRTYLDSKELKNSDLYLHFLRLLLCLKYSIHHETMLTFLEEDNGVTYRFNWEQFQQFQGNKNTKELEQFI